MPLPPPPLRLLPAGATVAGKASHPLRIAAFPRRTEKSGLKPLNAQVFRETEAEKYGPDFHINNTIVRTYEKGGKTSPPKLLTLAQIYNTPLSTFFRTLGATGAEICGHGFTESEQRFIELLKNAPDGDSLHL